MVKQRNFGVAEARVGLSVITCLLVALGYVIVHRLGDASAPADTDPGVVPKTAQANVQPGSTPGTTTQNNESDDRYGATPQTGTQQTAYRPQWLSPQNDSQVMSLPTLGIDDPAAKQGDRSDPSLEPLDSELRSGFMPDANPKR
jgi:hypothetical protein